MLDKLGVTGSSPVPPTIQKKARLGGFLLVHRSTSERPCVQEAVRHEEQRALPPQRAKGGQTMSDKEIRRVEDDSLRGTHHERSILAGIASGVTGAATTQ